uniref:P1 n=1 Tax=Stellaria aquatica mottle polerovirus A TaxID=3040039 RepID=A0A9Y2E8V0_9VIRU|nr:P1 [Stellaria aquatica mottle polerovirus A]
MNKQMFSFVLFFFFSLCSLSTEGWSPLGRERFSFPDFATSPYSSGGYTANFTRPSVKPVAVLRYDCSCPPALPLTSNNFSSLLSATWEVGYQTLAIQSRIYSSMGWKILKQSLEGCSLMLKDASNFLIKFMLESLIVSLWQLVRQFLTVLAYVLIHFMPQVVMLSLVGAILSGMFYAMKWIYSKVFAIPCAVIKFMLHPWIVLWRVKRPNKATLRGEKAIMGFTSFEIPQQPPRNSVVEIQYKDGSHSGYASCVKLVNGEIALMTALHGLQDEDLKVVGAGGSIPLSKFARKVEEPDFDFALLAGPTNWNSTLACKAADVIPATQIKRASFNFYYLKSGKWVMSNGSIEGIWTDNGSLMMHTLCNTEPGMSGTPLFCGKYIIGVHSGHPEENRNFNVAAAIPPIPKLTTRGLITETTHSKGLVFDPTFISDVAEKMLKYVPKTGRYWADWDEDDLGPVMKIKHVGETQKKSGNGNRGEVRVNNLSPRTPSPSSSSSGKSYHSAQPKQEWVKKETKEVQPTTNPSPPPKEQDITKMVVEAMINKVNMVELEKQVVSALRDQVLKKREPYGGKRKQRVSKPSSIPNTTGEKETYQPPHRRTSDGQAPSQDTTPPRENKKQSGGRNFANSTGYWRRKQQASAGQKPAPKQN